MIFNLELIISGIICSIILLQTSVIAPNIFKYLDQNRIQDLLRAIFPKLFFYILLLAPLSLVVGILDIVKFDIQTIIALSTVIIFLTNLSLVFFNI